MTNKYLLLYQQPHKTYLHLFFLFLLFILILLCLTHDEDSYELIGLKKGNDPKEFEVLVPFDKISIFDGKVYVKVDYEKYNITDIDYGDVMIENNIPVQKVTLKFDNNIDKEVVKFRVFYNKQRIIKKIIKIVKEG